MVEWICFGGGNQQEFLSSSSSAPTSSRTLYIVIFRIRRIIDEEVVLYDLPVLFCVPFWISNIAEVPYVDRSVSPSLLKKSIAHFCYIAQNYGAEPRSAELQIPSSYFILQQSLRTQIPESVAISSNEIAISFNEGIRQRPPSYLVHLRRTQFTLVERSCFPSSIFLMNLA